MQITYNMMECSFLSSQVVATFRPENCFTDQSGSVSAAITCDGNCAIGMKLVVDNSHSKSFIKGGIIF